MVRVRAPEFPDFPWLNCDRPLSLKQLRGRVVLLDFWTYCCINCLHVLPDLKYLEQKYPDVLTVIGVHSAKFDSEKEIDSIRQAILRYDIEHPVIVDSNFQIWQHYVVRAWPTIVVIDPEGYVVDQVSGEGHRHSLEELIEALISRHQGQVKSRPLEWSLEKRRQSIAPLAFPGKVLADQEGDRLFIADSGHHRLVITQLNCQLQQVIGTGTAGLRDGDFTEAQFTAPQGMALDPEQQCLYVADTGNHAIRCIDLQQQTVRTIAGTGSQSRLIYPHSGEGRQVALNSPWDLEKVAHFLMIAMAGSHQIWALDLEDGLLGTYAGTGAEACVDGLLEEAAFAQPSGLSSNDQELFVADSEGSSIRAVSLEAQPTVRTVCGSGDLFGFGDVDGQGEAVRLQHCLDVELDLELDRSGGARLWIADTYNHKIKQVDLQTGLCETRFGSGEPGLKDGSGISTCFYEPSGLSLAGSILYVADTNNHVIRVVDLTSKQVTTLPTPRLCAPDLCFPALVPDQPS
jgi:thiol-disulfide isomerase/thioredoxin